MHPLRSTLDYALELIQGVGRFVGKTINFVLLSAVYLFGAGMTKTLALILGKDFLPTKTDEKTSWVEHEKLTDPYRMF